jgi:predicted enzyme related to lactoylglutathione lyase
MPCVLAAFPKSAWTKLAAEKENDMLLGLRTVIYPTTDLKKATSWYTSAVGHAPYFDQPFYVGFNVGGYELGLLPANEAPDTSPVTYWGTSDIAAERERLIGAGAVPHGDIEDVGDGIKVATLKDPFGNTVGLIENPHFKGEQVA